MVKSALSQQLSPFCRRNLKQERKASDHAVEILWYRIHPFTTIETITKFSRCRKLTDIPGVGAGSIQQRQLCGGHLPY